MAKEHKKISTKKVQKGVLKRKIRSGSLESIDRLHELEELDSFKKPAGNKHVLTIRVKRPAKKPRSVPERPSDEEAALILENELARLRDEQESRTAPVRTRRTVDKTEKNKQLYMWSGVIICMLVITVVWIFNIKATLKEASINNNNQALAEWNKTTDQLAEQMEKIKANLDAIQSFAASSSAPKATTTTDPGTATPIQAPAATSISGLQLTELKDKIESIATSTEQ